MNDDDFADTISAALDGEAVDLPALRDALKTVEGRELLASCVLIRATAGADIEPSEQFSAALRKSFAPRRRWVLAGPRVPASIAASLVALAIAGTLFAGRAIQSTVPVDETRRPTAEAATAVGPNRAGTAPTAPTAPVPAAADRRPLIQPIGQPESARGPERREPPKPSRVLLFEGWRHGA